VSEGAEDTAGGVLIRREYKSFLFACSSLGFGIIGAQRAAELHEPKPKRSRRRSWRASTFRVWRAFRGEQIELLRAMRQAAQAYAEEADFAAMVTMLAKKILEDSEDVASSCVGSPSVFARV